MHAVGAGLDLDAVADSAGQVDLEPVPIAGNPDGAGVAVGQEPVVIYAARDGLVELDLAGCLLAWEADGGGIEVVLGVRDAEAPTIVVLEDDVGIGSPGRRVRAGMAVVAANQATRRRRTDENQT